MPRVIEKKVMTREMVPRVEAKSLWDLERSAERFLEEWQPEMLRRPEALDVRGLIRYLPDYDVTISPATADELGECEAVTRFDDYPEIEILVLEDQWHAVYERAFLTHRARATISHELGHAILHADQLHEAFTSRNAIGLTTYRRSDIEAYRDPEWQAWAWAGFLMMPRRILRDLDSLNPEYVSEVYDVSPEMARYYLRMLERNGLI